jgi:hypothetical protein
MGASTQAPRDDCERYAGFDSLLYLADVSADYIGRLRRSLTVQPNPPATEYLDGVAYWKDLFQSSQFEIRELQNKVSGLFMEVESLRSLGRPAPKRKAQEDLQPKRRNTRRKLAAPVLESQQTDHLTAIGWEDLSDSGQSASIV